jgi:hypothetical protein
MMDATRVTLSTAHCPAASDAASTTPMRRVRLAPAPPQTGPRPLLRRPAIVDEPDAPETSALGMRLRAITLTRRERRALFALARSFAWSDLCLVPRETEVLLDLARALDIGPADVQSALAGPPEPEEIDPALLPLGCPALVLDVALSVLTLQRPMDAEGVARFRLLEELVRAREACTI